MRLISIRKTAVYIVSSVTLSANLLYAAGHGTNIDGIAKQILFLLYGLDLQGRDTQWAGKFQVRQGHHQHSQDCCATATAMLDKCEQYFLPNHALQHELHLQ